MVQPKSDVVRLFRGGVEYPITVSPDRSDGREHITAPDFPDFRLDLDPYGWRNQAPPGWKVVAVPTSLSPDGVYELVVTRDELLSPRLLGPLSLLLGGVSAWLLCRDLKIRWPLLRLWRRAPLWQKGTLALLAVWFLLRPTGGDIRPIAVLVSLSGFGLDVFEVMKLRFSLDAAMFPAFAYPPVMLAVLQPWMQLMEWLFWPLFRQFPTVDFLRPGLSLLLLGLYPLAIQLLALSLTPPEEEKAAERLSLWLLFCPVPFYVTLVFQQVDILGVLLMAAGGCLISRGLLPLMMGTLIGLGLILKPQFGVIAPFFLLMAGVFCATGQPPARRYWLKGGAACLAVLVGQLLLNHATSYPGFVAALPQVGRIWQVLWGVGTGLVVYAVPFFMLLAYGLLLLDWKTTATPRQAVRLFYAASGVIVALYQAGFLHTPGMTTFTVFGLAVFLAGEPHWPRRLFAMGLSGLALASWVFTEGDVSRLLLPAGKTFSHRFASLLYSESGQSLLFTTEFAGLLLLAVICRRAYRSVGSEAENALERRA